MAEHWLQSCPTNSGFMITGDISLVPGMNRSLGFKPCNYNCDVANCQQDLLPH